MKCCLIPDKDKETKGKTSSFKLDSEDQGYASRGSSASSQSSTGSYSSIDSDVIAEKIMSVLKKRPHMGSRKNKNEGKYLLLFYYYILVVVFRKSLRADWLAISLIC